jgi:AcrR family transcriptional regulator
MPEIVSDAILHLMPPRERILLAARDLFHRQGIRRVGVEAIAEAAGTNKMTLYRHFDSKDNLIVAYLRGVASEADAAWREIERKNPGDGRAQLRSWLALAAECLASDDRGCDLANAAVELTEDGHPARRLIEQLKIEQRNRLAALCRLAGISQSEILADTLTLLFDGARVSRQAAGSKGPSTKFIRTAETVIEAFRAKSKTSIKRPPKNSARR